jgi:cytoskeletal protein RodZ
MSLGERFRAVREQRGLTLSDVAEHVRIRSVYLAAIEEENWKAIGAPVYIRGFLRTYARFLGLDPEEAVAEFNATQGASTGPVAAPAQTSRYDIRPQGGGSLGPLIWVAGIIAVVLVGFVIYLAVTPPRTSGQLAATAAAQPTAPSLSNASATAMPMSPTPSPSALPQTRTLAIHLTAPSWLRVTVDGNVSIEGTFPAGTSKSFHGKNALVRVGNAGGVEITVDGKPIGKLGATGDVAEKSFTL